MTPRTCLENERTINLICLERTGNSEKSECYDKYIRIIDMLSKVVVELPSLEQEIAYGKFVYGMIRDFFSQTFISCYIIDM